MSLLRLILASFAYHWRMNLAVAGGVAAGTAVLTGALLVGDSMRGSLRHLALDRLGRIDEVLLVEQFFRTELADELADEPGFQEQFSAATSAILLPASVNNPNTKPSRRANGVNLVGCDATFWDLGAGRPKVLPEGRQIVLNRPLAERLDVAPGDWVILHLPQPGTIPAESPLGRKDDLVANPRLKVVDVISAEGLGRFTLRPSQQLPRNAYVSRDWLAERLEQAGRCNAILVAGNDPRRPPDADAEDALAGRLHPRLDDYGIELRQTPGGYYNLTTQRMILAPAVEQELQRALAGLDVQPALTYLANTIARSGDQRQGIPYSTITAVDLAERPPLGPFLTPEGQPIARIGDDQIVLNSWAAADLKVAPGDLIDVTSFEPESTHGELRQRTETLTLAAVAELAGPAADRDFTPKVAGVTDEESMAQWDPPFPFDSRRIRDVDEKYWDDHGPTPKAFVSLATGRRLWSSRFGRTTSLRICPAEGLTLDDLRRRLRLDPVAMGFVFQPVKRQSLAASAGATPFNVLFLAFSFFIIAAAVMLVSLLFRLGMERRAAELGILLALGLGRRRVARLLLGEALLTALTGSLLGVPAGVAYAWLMLAGLRTWWLAAVATPFLRLYVTPASLLLGLFSGVVVALLTTWWTVHRWGRIAPRELLAGRITEQGPLSAGRSRYAVGISLTLLAVALTIGLAARNLGEEMQAGAFFGAGALVLTAGLIWIRARLKAGAVRAAVATGRGNLLRLAASNAARSPGRSTLSIGLIASASFLIVSISAFRLDPRGRTPEFDGGGGGFALIAQSDQPIYRSVTAPRATTYALRVKSGDDASCLNLYQPRQPRILGVPPALIDRGGFAWAATAAETPEQSENPWLLLDKRYEPRDGTPVLPVVIDKNTANYALHLWKGVGETYDVKDARGHTVVRLKVVGLLAGSIFQGDLLIAERALLEYFPEVSGYRFFLVETAPRQVATAQSALEDAWGDHGLTSETSGQRLADLLAVQNTYLSTFQSLAGLGLLLGTFGLATVQLRNVVQRRGELALLRATGFRRATLAWLVMLENGLLLLAGLACGVLAALVAVLPHLLGRAASIPLAALGGTLLLVLAVGLLAGLAAVRAVLRAPLLPALREER